MALARLARAAAAAPGSQACSVRAPRALATSPAVPPRAALRSSPAAHQLRASSPPTSTPRRARAPCLRNSAVVFAAASVPPPHTSTAPDWAAVRADIAAVIADPSVRPSHVGDKGPTLVRLAFHSSGTYDKATNTGGSGGGTIRLREELSRDGNRGLGAAQAWLEPVHKKHPSVSYADLFTLAGAVAIEAMGGPHIPWRAGRVDECDAAKVPPDGRLPEADKGKPEATAAGLRATFGRMGFNDQEIVALSGAHALGRCHPEVSGYEGPWQRTPTLFSNIYYKLLLKGEQFWAPDATKRLFQFKDPSGALMMLPSDMVLVQDAGFKQHVEAYAKDQQLFFADFAKAFQKLEELGTPGLTACDDARST